MAKKKNQLKDDVVDLLNQIVIKLKDVKHQEEYEYNDEGDEVENPNYKKEDHQLCVIKLVCKELASGNEYSDVMEYFNSYCYWNEND